ncbi:MAG: hypothetical protein JST30_10735 [Armatimonadetes bacterium]|nr:hypothetical protein [Armatimonadota bacterium]
MMRLLAALSLLAFALDAPAQKRPSLFGPGIRVEPVAVASAKIVSVKGKVVRVKTGPWKPYISGMQKPAASTTFAYDGCEFFTTPNPQDTFVTDGLYGPDCGKADYRYWFGATYKHGLRYEDLKVAPGAEGQNVDRIQFAWYQTANVNNSTTLVVTCDDFATGSHGNGLDPNTGRSDIDAVMVSFGGILGDTGYYFADVDLAGLGAPLRLPQDGAGGFLVAHGDYNGIDLFLGVGQNMMWGPGKSGNPSGPGQGAIWDDDFYPGDGFLDPDEFYDYTYGLCPDPLGAMLAMLYTPSSAVETLAPEEAVVELGKNASGSFQDLGVVDGVAERVCKFVAPNAQSPIVRIRTTYHTTKPQPTSIVVSVTARMATFGQFALRLSLSHDPDVHGSESYDTLLDGAPIGTGYQTSNGVAVQAPLSQYVGTDGRMSARTEIRQTGFSSVAAPCVLIDAAVLKVGG